jgi:molybdopterin-binding protein
VPVPNSDLENDRKTEKNYSPKDAAAALGISYSTLKQWIYSGKIRSVRTAGGHHRIPSAQLDRFLGRKLAKASDLAARRERFRRVSGRNQLIGRIVDLKVEGLMAQIVLSIGGQFITAIITADAVREMHLQVGDTAAALIKSTEVMITIP